MKPKVVYGPLAAKTRRLVLRPYTLSDYEVWRSGYLNRTPSPNPYDGKPLLPEQATRAFFRKLVARHNRMAKQDDCYVLGIYDRRTGAQLGFLDISTICRQWYQWASIGYVIHNQHQERGYAKEAGRAALRLAFRELGYKRVEASIRPDNLRSKKTAEGMGMRWDSFRPQYIFDNGEWEDHDIFVALNSRQTKRCYKGL